MKPLLHLLAMSDWNVTCSSLSFMALKCLKCGVRWGLCIFWQEEMLWRFPWVRSPICLCLMKAMLSISDHLLKMILTTKVIIWKRIYCQNQAIVIIIGGNILQMHIFVAWRHVFMTLLIIPHIRRCFPVLLFIFLACHSWDRG